MKRTIACVLALVLAMSLAFAVSAEEVKIATVEEETTSDFVDTIGAMPEEETPVTETVDDEEEIASDEIVINQFAQDEVASEEIAIEQFAEEETGFWTWLKGVWQAILNFFGL